METRPITPEEWGLEAPSECGPGGLPQENSRKIWMQFFHVFAVVQFSETNPRTNVRQMACQGPNVLLFLVADRQDRPALVWNHPRSSVMAAQGTRSPGT